MASKMKRSRNDKASANPTKRRKTTDNLGIGSRSEADLPSARLSAPSSSSVSTREVYFPSLSTLCIRSFLSDIGVLTKKWEAYRKTLEILPTPLLQRLFTAMKTYCPQVMSHQVVHFNFFRGNAMSLSSGLPITKATISALSELGNSLSELELVGLEKFSDDTFVAPLRKLPLLTKLVLRGSSKVGPETVQAVAAYCPKLKILNLNYTAVPPVSLAGVLEACSQLETLKVAGISNWTDATLTKLIGKLTSHGPPLFPTLSALKFRQSELTEASLTPLLAFCPYLKRLDISFTGVVHLPTNIPPQLEKLSLKSTKVLLNELLPLLSTLGDLKTLSLGALGTGQGASTAIGNSSALTMSDKHLAALTAVLSSMPQLDSVDLVQNSKLGKMDRRESLRVFMSTVGRRCKYLNLGGIASLDSSVLSGLLAENDDQPAQLETLVLSHTAVDDDAAAYIASCPALSTLDLSGTRFTRDGVIRVIDACSKLQKVDLTSCRGVPVQERRRFFEVWQEEQP